MAHAAPLHTPTPMLRAAQVPTIKARAHDNYNEGHHMGALDRRYSYRSAVAWEAPNGDFRQGYRDGLNGR